MPGEVFSESQIANGPSGTIATLAEMAKLSRQGWKHPAVIRAAHDVVRTVPERNDRATMSAMLAEVRRRMRYTRDPLGAELVKAPWVVVERTDARSTPEPMDCDDASTLLSSMLGAVGIPSKFVVVRTDPSRPSEFSHVYVSARTSEGRWVALDPIVRSFRVGDEVPNNRLAGPRGYFGVGSVGCDDCASCPKECSMKNRLNGYGFGSAPQGDLQYGIDAARDIAKDVISAKDGKRYGKDASTTRVNVSSGGFDWQEWVNPMYGGSLNLKAVAVLGVAAYLLKKTFFRGK